PGPAPCRARQFLRQGAALHGRLLRRFPARLPRHVACRRDRVGAAACRMSPLVTFVIPVRHPDNARDWALLRSSLSQTIASISNQTHDDWRAVIVANTGA